MCFWFRAGGDVFIKQNALYKLFARYKSGSAGGEVCFWFREGGEVCFWFREGGVGVFLAAGRREVCFTTASQCRKHCTCCPSETKKKLDPVIRKRQTTFKANETKVHTPNRLGNVRDNTVNPPSRFRRWVFNLGKTCQNPFLIPAQNAQQDRYYYCY